MRKILSLVLIPLIIGCFNSSADVKNKALSEKITDYRELEKFKESNWLFDKTQVREVRIKIDPEIFENVVLSNYSTVDENFYGYAESFSIDGEIIKNVGLRSRGNTSIDNHKRQFKVKFNAHTTYTSASPDGILINDELRGREFHEVRKLNFRASQNDPTIIREALSSHIFHKAGAFTTRNGFSQVYINDEYWGFYLITEQIEQAFLESRFDESKGALYKGVHGASNFVPGGEMRGFDYQTDNASAKSLRKLFVEILEGRKDIAVLEKLFNIDSVISYYAGATLTGHWDSFAFLGNNDYLYQHSKDDKYHIICWDTDNTFGSGKGWGFPTLETSIFQMKSNQNNLRVFSVILNDPKWREIYIEKLEDLLDNVYNPDNLFPLIDKWRTLIKDAVMEDNRKHVDWKYQDKSSANKAWNEAFDILPNDWSGGGFGDYEGGIKDWIEDRYHFVKNML